MSDTTLIGNAVNEASTYHLIAMAFKLSVATTFALSTLTYGLAMIWHKDFPKRAEKMHSFSKAIFLFSGVALGFFILFQLFSPSPWGLSDQVSLCVGIVLWGVTIYLDKDKKGMLPVGFLSSASIWLLIMVFSFLGESSSTAASEKGVLFLSHLFSAIIAQGLFITSLFVALVYLWAHNNLKNKRLEKNSFLPSLGKLERFIEIQGLAAIVCLTITLITGFLMHINSPVETSKIIWAFSAWVWHVATLFGKNFWMWRGRRRAWLAIAGGIFFPATWFGTIW